MNGIDGAGAIYNWYLVTPQVVSYLFFSETIVSLFNASFLFTICCLLTDIVTICYSHPEEDRLWNEQESYEWNIGTIWGPQTIAKLVPITTISLWFMVLKLIMN